MKKKFLFLMALLAVSLLALAEMTVYVYKKDGTKVSYIASNVDSIGFVNASYGGHEWVDLGLPSGTLWATCNIGADSPEEYGDYFAWGETESKSWYAWENYKWGKSSSSLTKYCRNSSYGKVDNKTKLELSDDAAYVNWGSDWRMPTKAEVDELKSNASWSSYELNGVSGYKVARNGKSIFLPYAKYRDDPNLIQSAQAYRTGGYYWTSSLDDESESRSEVMGFSSYNYTGSSTQNRNSGLAVRPVLRKTYTITFDANGGEGSMEVISLREEDSVTLIANAFTQTNSTFSGWNTAADGSGTAYTDQSTITPTANITLYAQWEAPTTGTENGHEWVDLGLPSGTKWATMNVGADSPEEYGDYFAWGETTTKSYYTESTYSYSSDPATLPLDRDAAYTNWGTSWRMPTIAEQDELRNTSYTTWTWTTLNGVKGYKVTSKINGNSIFLPAAGYRSSSELIDAGSRGSYWSSLPSASYAYYLVFGSGYVHSFTSSCYFGYSVRPVLAE